MNRLTAWRGEWIPSRESAQPQPRPRRAEEPRRPTRRERAAAERKRLEQEARLAEEERRRIAFSFRSAVDLNAEAADRIRREP